ncbi:butyrate kinase [Facklamia miroungae]|uniref:Probable butyrate kinase n=1 Tax=Facklamia miroungae TaxID=120956 RepID=A0A1G7T9G0_9LACT|nr:butyrate kinase [Facklamia miroungae]NKZ29717.1 butyrate kinase [Facklamia miroungae]SDG31722.1 butyrate kinase [Facklamia miroungae]
MNKIIVINPGATSTKVAYYIDINEVWKDEILYSEEQISQFPHIFDQLKMRSEDVLSLITEHGVTKELDIVVGRGGGIGPVKAGAILVDNELLDRLEKHPVIEHASNLGANLAQEVAHHFGKPNTNAYVYDPITVDSMSDVARLTGIKGVTRKSIGHHLNMRAVARRAASDIGKNYQEANVIVIHMGGGCSASAHQDGEIIDFISDDEVMFSAERSGGIAIKSLIPLIKEMGVQKFYQFVRNEAGLYSYFHTKDLRAIEERVLEGDQEAKLVLEAMALSISKTIACLAATLEGQVDAVSMTGGMAHSEFLTKEVKRRTAFIGPFLTYPGEFEMLALAKGGNRVLNHEETAHRLSEMI